MKDVLATYRFWQNSERNSIFINHMKIWYLYKGYSNCMIWFGKNYRNLINVVTFVCKFFPSESAWGFVMFAISTSIWYMQWISVFAFFFAQNWKKNIYFKSCKLHKIFETMLSYLSGHKHTQKLLWIFKIESCLSTEQVTETVIVKHIIRVCHKM